MAKILIAGDFCPQARVARLFENGDFSSVLNEIVPHIKKADFSIVNLECPITSVPNVPIVKRGPNLSCSKLVIEALKYAGFKCVTLANNHFRDYGDEACHNTINLLEKGGIGHVGGGWNLQEAQKVYYIEIDGVKVAIVNFCEHEFSIAARSSAGSAPLDLVDNYKQVCEAKMVSDFVIVIIHGGIEMYQLPTPRMQKTYRWFIDIGADIVINHHQHCFTGCEIYSGKPIFYGLGNFCFDRPGINNPVWNEGYIVTLTLHKEKNKKELSYIIEPYKQCEENSPSVRFLKGDELDGFMKKYDEFSDIISDPDRLSKAYDCFLCECSKSYILETEPGNYIGLLNSMRIRNLLPKLHNKKSLLHLYSILNCESHFDILKRVVAQKVGF